MAERSPDINHERPIPGARALFANPLGIMLVAGLGAFAAYREADGAAGICAVLLAAGLLARVWGRLATNNLDFKVNLSQTRGFPGDETLLNMRLHNRKLLPLSWVEVFCRIPVGLLPEKSSKNADETWFKAGTPLLWHQWVEFNQPLYCSTRGVYELGPAELATGDIFGLLQKSKKGPKIKELIVYPKIYELNRLGLPSRFPLGASKAANRLFEDPARSVGLRDYVHGTPLKYIHWKASARQQRLQVKVFEPTTSLQLAIFLDVESFTDPVEADIFEQAVSTAASVAWEVVNTAQPVGLYANGRLEGQKGPLSFSPRTGHKHLANLLEALARLKHKPTGPLPSLLKTWVKAVMPGDTLLVIAARVTDDLKLALEALKVQGFKVRLLSGRVESICPDNIRPASEKPARRAEP